MYSLRRIEMTSTISALLLVCYPLNLISAVIFLTCELGIDGDKGDNTRDPKWLPLPLRLWFWVPFVVILALGAIGLEIALHFSKKNQGEFRV